MKNLHPVSLPFLSCLVFLFSTISLNGQEAEKVPQYKSDNALHVFNKLKESLGLLPGEKPHFFLQKELPNPDFKMAMIFYNTGEIFLEEAAYDLCTSFGKDSLNALAVYLGHELAHFHEEHFMANHFAFAFEKDFSKDPVFKALEAGLAPAQKDSIIDIVKTNIKGFTSTENEKEADLKGGFIAYLSGFQTFDIAPDLLQKTYDKFDLDPVTEGYPSLEQRKKIAKNSDQKLKNLIDYFEIANLLIAVGEYDDAILYYNKILDSFKSREIYNNLGVLNLLSYLDNADNAKVQFGFPIELDVVSRMATGGRGTDLEIQKLNNAVDFLEKASVIDKDYPVAHLNLACAHALLGIAFSSDANRSKEEYALATAAAYKGNTICKADVNSWKQTSADLQVILGIINAKSNQNSVAESFFKEAIKIIPDHQLAKMNLAILNPSNAFASNASNSSSPTLEEEQIDNQAITEIKMTLDNVKEVMLDEDDEIIRFMTLELEQSRMMSNFVVKGTAQRFSSFHFTNRDYNQDTSNGISKGASLSTIKNKYGEPTKIISLGNGTWLKYDTHKVIFQLDQDGKLTRWCVFNHKV